jgi:hypothetical protein
MFGTTIPRAVQASVGNARAHTAPKGSPPPRALSTDAALSTDPSARKPPAAIAGRSPGPPSPTFHVVAAIDVDFDNKKKSRNGTDIHHNNDESSNVFALTSFN